MSRAETNISDRLIAGITASLDRGSSIRRKLPLDGRVHIDRPLPFLCVYRQPAEQEDPGTQLEREALIKALRQDRMLMPKTKGRPDKHTRRQLIRRKGG